MTVLQPNEYNASYFDGASQSLKHNAGFSKYVRWERNGSEFWLDIAKHLKEKNILSGKVLELASAKGFITEDLRNLGIDAYGIDVSQYAYDQADPSVKPYLTVGDVRTALAGYSNKEFDFVFSVRLMECVDDADIPDLITEINRISKKQAHIITTGNHINTNYYNFKSLSSWLSYDWNKKTVLSQYNKLTNFLIK